MLETLKQKRVFNLTGRLPTLNVIPATAICLWFLVLVCGCGGNALKLEGFVSDNFGNPVDGAVIEATMLSSADGELPRPPMTSTSQESGSYRIDNLQLGNYQISVAHPNYGSPEPRSELLTETLVMDLELHNKLSLQGTVFETDRQTPAYEAEVRITGDDNSRLEYDKKTDANGKFTVSNLKLNDQISIKIFKGSDFSTAADVTITKVKQKVALNLKEITSQKAKIDSRLKVPTSGRGDAIRVIP